MDKDIRLRIKVKCLVEKFVKNGTKIELLENKPEIFYSSHELSKCIDSIMKAIKETP